MGTACSGSLMTTTLNYEISTMWKTSKGQPLKKTSRLLMGSEQVTRSQTLQVDDDEDAVGSIQINTSIYRNIILPVLYGFETWYLALTKIIG
jgi:hypothetical protein